MGEKVHLGGRRRAEGKGWDERGRGSKAASAGGTRGFVPRQSASHHLADTTSCSALPAPENLHTTPTEPEGRRQIRPADRDSGSEPRPAGPFAGSRASRRGGWRERRACRRPSTPESGRETGAGRRPCWCGNRTL